MIIQGTLHAAFPVDNEGQYPTPEPMLIRAFVVELTGLAIQTALSHALVDSLRQTAPAMPLAMVFSKKILGIRKALLAKPEQLWLGALVILGAVQVQHQTGEKTWQFVVANSHYLGITEARHPSSDRQDRS